jgi:hypothetical protein
MDGELSQLLFGAIGGGLVAAVFRIAEQWVERRSAQSVEARKTLAKYAKPLWLACHNLEQRLTHIHAGLKNPQVLTCVPERGCSLDWYTKEGYYATSTVYLLAYVSAWITLFQREIVFLEFRNESLTAQFFQSVEQFKGSISTGTILWYHYLVGIGQQLLPMGADRPMTLAVFVNTLGTNDQFRAFFDQSFQFLKKIAASEYRDQIGTSLAAVQEIQRFLVANQAVPVLTRQREGVEALG